MSTHSPNPTPDPTPTVYVVEVAYRLRVPVVAGSGPQALALAKQGAAAPLAGLGLQLAGRMARGAQVGLVRPLRGEVDAVGLSGVRVILSEEAASLRAEGRAPRADDARAWMVWLIGERARAREAAARAGDGAAERAEEGGGDDPLQGRLFG